MTASLASEPRRVARRAWRRSFGVGAGAVSLLVGALVWELGARAADFIFLPPLSTVLARLATLFMTGVILPPLVDSLGNLLVGFGFSLVVGITVGVLMGTFRSVDAMLRPYANAMLSAPSLVFAPIFFTFFGIGRVTVIAIIIFHSLFFLIPTTTDAIKGVPRPLIDMGVSFTAGRGLLIRRIMLPAALPMIMAGIRVSAGRAVKGMINGEMFIAAIGLGKLILRAESVFDVPTVLAVSIFICAIAMLVGWLVQRLDRRLTSWLPTTARRGNLEAPTS